MYNTNLVQRQSEHLEAFLSLLPDEQGCGSDLHTHPDLCERYQKLQLSGPQNVPLSHWLKTQRLLGAVYTHRLWITAHAACDTPPRPLRLLQGISQQET